MPARPLRLFCLLSCLLIAATAFAQEGHPIKGTWVGYWGPTATQNRVVIVMDYDGKTISLYTPAQKVYESLGFRETGRYALHFFRDPVPAWMLTA